VDRSGGSEHGSEKETILSKRRRGAWTGIRKIQAQDHRKKPPVRRIRQQNGGAVGSKKERLKNSEWPERAEKRARSGRQEDVQEGTWSKEGEHGENRKETGKRRKAGDQRSEAKIKRRVEQKMENGQQAESRQKRREQEPCTQSLKA
jgi:hypothetical protein